MDMLKTTVSPLVLATVVCLQGCNVGEPDDTSPLYKDAHKKEYRIETESRTTIPVSNLASRIDEEGDEVYEDFKNIIVAGGTYKPGEKVELSWGIFPYLYFDKDGNKKDMVMTVDNFYSQYHWENDVFVSIPSVQRKSGDGAGAGGSSEKRGSEWFIDNDKIEKLADKYQIAHYKGAAVTSLDPYEKGFFEYDIDFAKKSMKGQITQLDKMVLDPLTGEKITGVKKVWLVETELKDFPKEGSSIETAISNQGQVVIDTKKKGRLDYSTTGLNYHIWVSGDDFKVISGDVYKYDKDINRRKSTIIFMGQLKNH